MHLSRRTFLLGSAAGLVLAACGGSSSSSGGTSGAAGTTALPGGAAGGAGSSAAAGAAASPDGFVALQFFPPSSFPMVAGQAQRWPFGVGNTDGVVVTDNAPAQLRAVVRDDAGNPVGSEIVVPRHSKDLFRPYYPLTTDLPAGTYQVTFLLPDGKALAPAFFSVKAKGSTTVPVPGDVLKTLSTPTTKDGKGVNPVCTQDPPCPFHDVSVDEALKSGKKVAMLVGTPAYCQTGICGPVLKLLEAAAPAYSDKIEFVHVEIYTDSTLGTVAPAVKALGLDYEPALFLIEPDGTVQNRVDVIFDSDELKQALDTLAAA